MIALDGNSLSLDRFSKIVLESDKVSLSPDARKRLEKGRAIIDAAVKSGERVYSINTGFGILSRVTIDANSLDALQVNLIRSHCVGVGEPHTETESRAILLLRTNCLAKGFSGVRPLLVDRLIELLNARIHPVVPSKGSVGASGDLAPLAHLAAVLLGEGEAFFKGKRMSGSAALKEAGIQPVVLAPKEGLSLINGTQQMTALGSLVLRQAMALCDLADLICATSLEGVLGSPSPFTDWIQATRPHPGQAAAAKNLRNFLRESEVVESHVSCDRVQDSYSFRCAPQVHGASRDLIQYAKGVLEIEMNAATDNPLINAETGELFSNGNFHGQPVAAALDVLAMGIAELGSLSERRTAKLIDPTFSELPAFLVKNEGLNSGLMMAQVTAASLVSENKLLCHPASSDSIPTNNEKEDHVSMGPLAARKAKTILENTRMILAIEAIAACQALEFRKPLKPGLGPRVLYELMREKVAPLDGDRYLHPDLQSACELLGSGAVESRLKREKLL